MENMRSYIQTIKQMDSTKAFDTLVADGYITQSPTYILDGEVMGNVFDDHKGFKDPIMAIATQMEDIKLLLSKDTKSAKLIWKYRYKDTDHSHDTLIKTLMTDQKVQMGKEHRYEVMGNWLADAEILNGDEKSFLVTCTLEHLESLE